MSPARSAIKAVATPGLSRRMASVSAAPSAIPSSSPSAPSGSTSQPAPKSKRIYGERKTFLHAFYSHLLRSNEMVLLFAHDNLSVADLLKIRRAIAKIPPPAPAPVASASALHPASPSSAPKGELPDTRAKLTISRTGLLSSLFKPSRLSPKTAPSLMPFLEGPTALMTAPSLSPAYVSKILSTIHRTIKSVQRDVPPNTPKEKMKQPKLQLVAGILEGNRLVGVQEMEAVNKLPDLDILRAQVVGLLESQGRGLLGVISQAGGGSLLRTLQGREEDLKKENEGPAA